MLSVQMCVGIGFSGVDQHMEAILDVSGKAATERTRDNPLCCPKLGISANTQRYIGRRLCLRDSLNMCCSLATRQPTSISLCVQRF